MLDEIDVKILKVLQREGRISMLNLADRVGLSSTPCARRVKQMEDSGVIESYVALVNPQAIGMKVAALINVQLQHSKQFRQIFEHKVTQISRVLGCFVTAGTNDYLLYVVAKDISDLAEWSRDVLITIPGVSHTHTSVVLEILKSSTELPLDCLSEK
jgi:Lrp/AsnC family leucine-responsive transcriptional regulator